MRRRLVHLRISVRTRAAFTLIEVMFATLLMGIVGAAILSFMSAFASGIAVRSTVNDPALESSLAARKFAAVAPGFSYLLEADGGRAAIWLGDTTPSFTVHRSEVGILRFEPTRGMLILETFDPAILALNPLLEQEFAFTPATDFIGALDSARESGAVLRQVLAEGVTSVSFATAGLPAGDAELTLNFQMGTGRIALSPVYRERPFR